MNTIQVYHAEGGWHATIGRDSPQHIDTGPHETPAMALAAIFREALGCGWAFDPEYRPS